jgi:hypothetical protein
VNVTALLRGWERRIARLNKWLTPIAVSSNVRNIDQPGTVDPLHVTMVMGEIEQGSASSDDPTGQKGG